MKKRNKKNTILALFIGFCAIISLLMPIIISFFPVLIFGYEIEYSSKVITGEITLIEPNDYSFFYCFIAKGCKFFLIVLKNLKIIFGMLNHFIS